MTTQLAEAWAALRESGGQYIGVDTETTGLSIHAGKDHLMGVCLAVGEQSWYLPVAHPKTDNLPAGEVAALVRYAFEHHRPVFHHWKYDAAVLAQLGVEPALPAWDTLVGSWLENENRHSHKLKDLAASILGEDAKAEQRGLQRLLRGPTLDELAECHYYPDGPPEPDWEALVEGRTRRPRSPVPGMTWEKAKAAAREDPRYQGGQVRTWADLTGAEVAPYGAKDAALTLAVHRHQLERVAAGRPDITTAMPRELAWQGALFRMEEAGIRVNQDTAYRLRSRAAMRKVAIEEGFERHFGCAIGSTVQLAALVYGEWRHRPSVRTGTGKPSTSREALEDLAFDPRVELILEWRRLAKACSAYYDPLLERLDPEGRVHPSFNADTGSGRGGAARTGRLTCSDPNLQTIPREGGALDEVRQVFCAAPGYELWEYDLSQAELRFAAALSRDTLMCEAFAAGQDLYALTAAELGCARQVAKTVTLAYQYGAQPPRIAATLARAEARRLAAAGQRKLVRPNVVMTEALVSKYRTLYPRLAWAMLHWEDIARQEGRIPLAPAGRYRNFRGAGYVEEYRKAFNSAAQGGVAELMKDLQLGAEPVAAQLGARFVLQVHDSLVAEVPPGAGPELGLRLQALLDQLNPFPWVRQLIEPKLWTGPDPAGPRPQGVTS